MSKATWRYFSTPALNTVGPNLPPHLTQIPFNGARRGFQLHFEHLDLCDVNVRRLPTKSRRMWVPRTFLATSSPFTATILSARSSCSLTLSSIVGSSLYALISRALSRSSVGWVTRMFQLPDDDSGAWLRVGTRSSLSYALVPISVFY